jgi:broad specificity phosphatase PhoE
VAIEITMVRHGETVANVAGLWQGRTESDLSPTGADQAKRVGARLGREHFDLVLTSPASRARATAQATGFDAEIEEPWREMDLGAWEGLTRAEVDEQYGDEVAAFRAGEDVRVGGTGETVSELVARSVEALRSLVDRLDDGDRALVVSHGGPIMMAAAALLGAPRRGPLHPILNTSITRIHVDGDHFQVSVFNDTSHLNGFHPGFMGDTQVVLIRHGQTESNVESRWQGRQNGMLTSLGREQVEKAAAVFPRVDGLYSSPLGRALDTAAPIAGRLELDITTIDDLAEMSFGGWENLTAEEIKQAFPDEWERVDKGDDVPRGGFGETYGGAGERLAAAVADIAARHEGGVAGAVTHGGVSRAYVTHLLGTSFVDRHRLHLLNNTAMARIVVSGGRPVLADYNVAPHL